MRTGAIRRLLRRRGQRAVRGMRRGDHLCHLRDKTNHHPGYICKCQIICRLGTVPASFKIRIVSEVDTLPSPSELPPSRPLMRVPKERIPPVGLIRKRHLFPQLHLLLLAHPLQSLFILPVQHPIIPSQDQYDKTQRAKGCNDTNLAGNIPRRFFGLESLGAEDVARCERNHGEGVDGDLFGMTGDVSVSF